MKITMKFLDLNFGFLLTNMSAYKEYIWSYVFSICYIMSENPWIYLHRFISKSLLHMDNIITIFTSLFLCYWNKRTNMLSICTHFKVTIELTCVIVFLLLCSNVVACEYMSKHNQKIEIVKADYCLEINPTIFSLHICNR